MSYMLRNPGYQAIERYEDGWRRGTAKHNTSVDVDIVSYAYALFQLPKRM
jgi:hypothetical protein